MTEPIVPTAADQREGWAKRLEKPNGAGRRAAVVRRLHHAEGGRCHLPGELLFDARTDVARKDDRDLTEAQLDHD